MPHDLILASSSPRRRELLREAGYDFRVVEPRPEAEDGGSIGEAPQALVARLAEQKALDVAGRIDRGIVIGCDTVADCEGQILGKPEDENHARAMLELLSGREHHCHSGLCLIRVPGGQPRVEIATTTLRMDALSRSQIDEYLASGLWQGKAGAFGLQDRLGWLHILAGSASNVVGLPLELLAEMLARVR